MNSKNQLGNNLLKKSIFSLLLVSFQSIAQQSPVTYGPPISYEQAKKVMAEAEAEALKNKWRVVIAVVDSGGHLVALQRLDAQTGSVDVAIGKATTSASFMRTSKSIEDVLTAGGAGLRMLGVKNLTPLQGGVPIVYEGKIIGAIGVSGVLASQDELVALAGAAAIVGSR
jgi:glc operon protein GlcG